MCSSCKIIYSYSSATGNLGRVKIPVIFRPTGIRVQSHVGNELKVAPAGDRGSVSQGELEPRLLSSAIVYQSNS